MSKKEQIADLQMQISDLKLQVSALQHEMEALLERLEDKITPKKRWPETSPPWFSSISVEYRDLFKSKHSS